MVKIPLISRSGEILDYALIDDVDWELVSKYKWRLKRFKNIDKKWKDKRYAQCGAGGEYLLMHRLIMKAPKSRIIDHINHNGLDNRRKNLRVTSTFGNSLNRRDSVHCGIWWQKEYTKYRIKAGWRLRLRNKNLPGRYDSLQEAQVVIAKLQRIAQDKEFALLT